MSRTLAARAHDELVFDIVVVVLVVVPSSLRRRLSFWVDAFCAHGI